MQIGCSSCCHARGAAYENSAEILFKKNRAKRVY